MTENRDHFDVVVVGAGASGIMAAVSAKRRGAKVLLVEKMPRPGKKILVSGNGRCNLMNETLNGSFYNHESRSLVESVFALFGKQEILDFFKKVGLMVYSDKGRIFPATNQARSVLDVLEMELARLGTEIRCGLEVTAIRPIDGDFTVMTQTGLRIHAGRVILCGGGKSYPVTGSDGGCYALASSLGHHLVRPVPSAVPLIVKDPWCGHLQGQKIRAVVTVRLEGKNALKADGELLFTKYGLSGTAILDTSEVISIALNRDSQTSVSVAIDLLPWMHEETLRKELSGRLRRRFPVEKILSGLLPYKFGFVFSEILKTGDPAEIARRIKHKEFLVTGTRGWGEADFTAGGVESREINAGTLESKICQGLYLAGEILDVQGARGGYNLAWAWASGFMAGR